MEQAIPVQQFQQQHQAATQLISNVHSQPGGLAQSLPPQQAAAYPGLVAAAFQAAATRPAVPAAAQAQHPTGLPAGMQPASAPPPSLQGFQLAMPPASMARPPGGVPAPMQQAPRPAQLAQPQVPQQIPPAMLPLLGYPLPLLQSMQNVSADELSKHTGIPLALLQAQPQMQLAARQIMLQRIMAFQFQAQQAAQQQQAQRAPVMPQHQQAMAMHAQQQRVAPAAAAPKPKPPPKPKAQQAKQPKAAPAVQRAQPTSSDGTAGQGEVGGKLIWAKLGTYPWWPAKTLGEGDPSFPPDADPPRPTSIPIRFFGTYEFCWIGSKRAIADWDEAYDEHVRSCDQDSFRAAVEEVEHYKRTGELPQVFYIRPPPEGRAKARGKRRARPRSAPTPGAIGAGMVGMEDAYGTPTSALATARPRPQGKTPQAVEDRATVVRMRRKRLLQELGLAPPDESPYANGRICRNPALLKLQPEFDEQWPPATRPAPEPVPAPAPPAQPSAPPPPAPQAAPPAASAALGPAAALAAALAGRPVGGPAPVQHPSHLQGGAGGPGHPLPIQLAQQHLAASQPHLAHAAAPPAGPAGPSFNTHQFPAHLLPHHQQQAAAQQAAAAQAAQAQLSLAQLQQLTPQQVALMAGLVQQAQQAAQHHS